MLLSSDKKTLKDILDIQGETTIHDFIAVKILQSKAPISYKTKAGVGNMLELIIADQTSFCTALAYHEVKFPILVQGECIIVNNVIKKENRYFYFFIICLLPTCMYFNLSRLLLPKLLVIFIQTLSNHKLYISY